MTEIKLKEFSVSASYSRKVWNNGQSEEIQGGISKTYIGDLTDEQVNTIQVELESEVDAIANLRAENIPVSVSPPPAAPASPPAAAPAAPPPQSAQNQDQGIPLKKYMSHDLGLTYKMVADCAIPRPDRVEYKRWDTDDNEAKNVQTVFRRQKNGAVSYDAAYFDDVGGLPEITDERLVYLERPIVITIKNHDEGKEYQGKLYPKYRNVRKVEYRNVTQAPSEEAGETIPF